MENKKSLYIASAVCTALSVVANPSISAKGHYDAAKKRCYGASLAGQNDCPSGGHSCKGTATTDCNPKDWKIVRSQKECHDMMAKNCPQNLKKR
jgi:uncharacterized membrane protein